jgi:hypothetical protein
VIALGAAGPVGATCADVALVLAIDASGSVKEDEFALQQQGYAQAFRSPRVRAALSDAGIVDIGALLFSDSERDLQIMPMTRLVRGAGADDLARRLEDMPRPAPGNTGIGIAIAAAIRLLDAPGACAHRRIVNLSGDGPGRWRRAQELRCPRLTRADAPRRSASRSTRSRSCMRLLTSANGTGLG